MKREALPGGGVHLEVAGPRRPDLAVMVAAGRRLMVAQSGRPVLMGRVDDRAVAALAEGVDPPCLLLSRGVEVSLRDEMLDLATAHHLVVISRLAGRELDVVVRGFAAMSASLPYDRGRTRAWGMSRSAWEAALADGALADGAPGGRG